MVTIPTSLPKAHIFRFENAWLKNTTFLPLVLPAWTHCWMNAAESVGALVARIKAIRHATKLWARKHRSPLEIYYNCSFLIKLFDMFEERRNLSAGERGLRQRCREWLTLFINQRAAYWKQRGKFRALQEGDVNARYFQARATARARRGQIHHLEIDGVTMVSHSDNTAALTSYYANVLGSVVTTS